MQPNQRTRFVLLLAVITLALTGATVSTTTGGLTDEEEVTLGEVEASWNESVSTDEEQPNETSRENGIESDSNETNSDEMSGNETGLEANESGNQSGTGDASGEDSDNDGAVTADSSQNASTTESNGQGTNETTPNSSTRR
ncbi:hypothetical protein [Natrinema sp. CGMCC1.2065]|uniref:hypothetical protein n=1 Tax=Natrinema sp. CGMCC1.2065 TaxID=3445767 RepID=UPI003F4A5730